MIARAQVAVPEYADEVVRGLTSAHKTLPCKLFYDDRGSAIFEEITRLPEYYPTRTEMEILRDRSREIAQAVGSPVSVVELGAGTATKTGTLLSAFTQRQMRLKYFPVDISPAALEDADPKIDVFDARLSKARIESLLRAESLSFDGAEAARTGSAPHKAE